ncbi:MAG TPA: PAS-domain containing protein [Hyphomicrobiaceae bacterium]|nr:PAS-domain containing protein [Hyphomicrobiaceae bacterium]
MRIAGKFSKDTSASARVELLLLLAASICCAVVLSVAVGGAKSDALPSLKLVYLLALAIGAGCLSVLALKFWQSTSLARRLGRRRREEITELRKNLAAAESMLRAEPQVLVYWQQGESVRIVSHTLSTVPGLPEDPQQLLRFGQWLEPAGAHELKDGLDALFSAGRPFSMLLRTVAGGHVEAEGRVSGGRAILRLRDVAGYRRDLARIIDQHRQLARDITLSRALFNALPLPVWIRGADGRLEWVNKAYVTCVEAADEEEVRERQIELLESRQRQDVHRSLTRGETFRKRMPLIIGGERKAHDIVALPMGEASVAAAIDATAIEHAQGELERQIEAYDRTLHRVVTAVAIFGPDQKLTFFNDAFRKLWQLDADWLASHPAHGEILDRLRELSRLPPVVNYREWKSKVLAGYKTGADPEEWWHLPDGRSLHVMAEGRPDGGMTYLYDDATERLALESRYNALIDVQRETLDHLKEGVSVFGTDGRLKLFNSAFERIWKLSRRTLQDGPHIEEIVRQCRILHDDPRGWDQIASAATAISDKRQPIEGQMTRADQSVIDFAALPLPDGGTLVTFADVTDSKRYERALIERNDALVAADRLKSQFISHVSYELRTPLTNIIGFSELLESPRTGSLNSKQREYLNDVSASSKTLLAIIDDILDLANIDAGALELKLAPLKVRPVIDAAVLGVRDRAARARIALDIVVADDAVDLIADEGRVRQVLYNLLSNAIGFSMPGGRVQLICRREAGNIAFTVIDEGVGIPRDQQRSVLERFVSRSQGSKHRGAGLGLSIVKSLVELHGGHMTLDSEPGRGTSVTVHFPENGVRPARTSEPVARRA